MHNSPPQVPYTLQLNQQQQSITGISSANGSGQPTDTSTEDRAAGCAGLALDAQPIKEGHNACVVLANASAVSECILYCLHRVQQDCNEFKMHSVATYLLQHILDLLVHTCIQFVRAENTGIAVAFLYKQNNIRRSVQYIVCEGEPSRRVFCHSNTGGMLTQEGC